jgi:hypothetical protein
MAEEVQIESIGTIGPQLHDSAHGINESRPAIRGKPHDLVLVAIVWKAKKLGDCLVEDAERMREIDVPIDSNRGALADAPSRPRKIPKSIN